MRSGIGNSLRIMVIVIYGIIGGGVWRALCTLEGCSSAFLRVAALKATTLKGPGTEANALEDSKTEKTLTLKGARPALKDP
jgi:hypothetical protein